MENKTYFGFALADGMFSGDVTVSRRVLTVEQAKELIPGAIPCLNPSHLATINAMRQRYGIEVAIPDRPPLVKLNSGDSLVIMAVQGLPRLTDRHEYTSQEIETATFQFVVWTVA